MKTSTRTVSELNATQAAWMALAPDCDQNSPHVRRVLAELALAPASHITFTTPERDRALAIIQCQPATADRVPIEKAKEILRRYAKDHGKDARLDIAWNAEAGQWISL